MRQRPKFSAARFGLVLVLMGMLLILREDTYLSESAQFWMSLALVTIGSALFTNADWGD